MPAVRGSLVVAAALLVFTLPAATPYRVSLLAGGRPDSLVADPALTRIGWRTSGSRAASGAAALKSGLIVTRHERLLTARFDVDLSAARGAVWIDVARHPVAHFEGSGFTRIGLARYRVEGELTLGGFTRPVSFETDVRWEEFGHMVATAELALDPRRFGAAADRSADELRVSLTLHARRRSTVAVR